MKKFLTVLMVAMLMFVTGCGNNDISELNVDETKKIIGYGKPTELLKNTKNKKIIDFLSGGKIYAKDTE